MDTGRPIENPEARYYRTGRPFVSVPGAAGAHNWQPMAFSPQTGLVYIPAQDRGLPLLRRAELAAGGAGLQQRARHGRGGDAGRSRGARTARAPARAAR